MLRFASQKETSVPDATKLRVNVFVNPLCQCKAFGVEAVTFSNWKSGTPDALPSVGFPHGKAKLYSWKACPRT